MLVSLGANQCVDLHHQLLFLVRWLMVGVRTIFDVCANNSNESDAIPNTTVFTLSDCSVRNLYMTQLNTPTRVWHTLAAHSTFYPWSQ